MAELSRQNDRRSEHDVTAGINGMSPTKSRDANALNFLGPSPAALSASLQRLDRVVLVVVAAAVEGAAAVVVVLALVVVVLVLVVVVALANSRCNTCPRHLGQHGQSGTGFVERPS